MTNEAEKTTGRGLQRRTGIVTAISGDKTVRVTVNTRVKHPQYGKYIRRRTRLAVHDPKGTAKIGDVVEIRACRRISKTKAWRLLRVVRHSVQAALAAGRGE